jgi:hypothetical protein
LPSALALVIHQIGRSKAPELRSALDLDEAEYIVKTVTPIDDFSVAEFASGGVSHRVYHKGVGPDVLLMHELPGMTPQFIGLARTIADAGFTVHLPLLFGEPGERHTVLFLARLCISRDRRTRAAHPGDALPGCLQIRSWPQTLLSQRSRRCGRRRAPPREK